MLERHQGLKSGEHGKDESSSIKLLTRHKGVELEIDTYSGIIQVRIFSRLPKYSHATQLDWIGNYDVMVNQGPLN